ncbi:DNA glycosylase [Xylariaceae sp. FL0016]|nr:DNA glycosylase [Xylariaceae sp. FL0016]
MSARRSARLSAASTLKAFTTMAPPPPPAPGPRGRKRKAAATAQTAPNAVIEKEDEVASTAPTTPNKRRVRQTPVPPPATPTPSNAKLMGEPAAPSGTTPTPKPRGVSRLADPNLTNATLLSPETSRVVASTRAPRASESPTKQTSISVPARTTTATLLEQANAHLISVDPRMKRLVENNHCRVFSPEGLAEKIDPFESLCSGIISQQVSGAAAKAIKSRFVSLFADAPDSTSESSGGRFPHPSQVVACPIERLRSCGLSQRKAEYVQGLAERFTTGALSAQMLANAPYDEVLEKLIAVRGLGKWSVEMFACFGLKRMDVFSLGDLGIQRGMAAFEGRDVAKLKSKGGKNKYMSEKDMSEIAARFAPYRSLFMWYMWRVEETDVSTME